MWCECLNEGHGMLEEAAEYAELSVVSSCLSRGVVTFCR